MKTWKKFASLAICSLLLITFFASLPQKAMAAGTITLSVSNNEDITDKFIAAAKQARESNGTTTIVIPSGTYRVGQLRIWGNTTVMMNGVELIRNGSSTSSMLRFGSKSQDWDPYNGGKGRPGYSSDFSNVRFVGGTWNGNSVKASIMQIGHAANLSFENVTFTNVKEAHHLELGAVKDVKITGCTFKNFVGDFGSNYNGEAIQLEILSSSGKHFNGYNPNTDETICQNVEIASCTFSKLKRGVGTHNALTNSYFTKINIHDNTFTDITGYAISMMNYINSNVYNNTIKNCGAGIICTTTERSHKNFYAAQKTPVTRSTPMVMNDKIYNNNITITVGANGKKYNNVNFGIYVFGEKLKKQTGTCPKGDWRISGLKIEKNTITLKCTGYGIQLVGAVNNTCQKNKITCNVTKKGTGGTGDGIRLESSTNNVIKSNTIVNKTVKGAAAEMCGISVKPGSDSNKIEKNTIKNASKDGIRVEKSKNVTIVGNKIEKTGRDGIKVENGKKITIMNNTIKKAKRYGIFSAKKQLKKESGNKISGTKSKKNLY